MAFTGKKFGDPWFGELQHDILLTALTRCHRRAFMCSRLISSVASDSLFWVKFCLRCGFGSFWERLCPHWLVLEWCYYATVLHILLQKYSCPILMLLSMYERVVLEPKLAVLMKFSSIFIVITVVNLVLIRM